MRSSPCPQRPNRVSPRRAALAGQVSDGDLAGLDAGAECMLHPALLEGFGLTPLESLAAGTPVVGFRAGAVEEVVGDAGLLVENDRPETLGDALIRYLDDAELRSRLRTRTKARAALFSWERAARDTLALYRTLA